MTMPSLPEVYRTIAIPIKGGSMRKFFAFAGPAYMVSVGYMDPGNWATDLEGGSRYGYALLWVVLASNLMAQLLQILCARLGLVTGKDLAQACRDYYKKPAAIVLWVLCEIAIIACDLAEVIGSAVALQLLFGIPLLYGVLITAVDVLILLGLMHFGFRKLEAIVLTLVVTIAACFALEIYMSRPDIGGIIGGMFKPSLPDTQALYIALGILGATVMPHNLYLHSSIVQTRAYEKTSKGIKQAIRSNTLDTIVALSAAFFVNAAILILAAAVFHGGSVIVTEFKQAPELLRPVLGGAAATAFSIALLASGQSSTITGTLAGQIVMEGFLRIKVVPWLRRLITRSIAIIPALILITIYGGQGTIGLVTLSQVVLSMQLSFAIFPLMMFTSNKNLMGEFVNPLWLRIVGYGVCVLIAGANIYFLAQKIGFLWMLLAVGVLIAFSAWVKYGYKEKPRGRQATCPC